MFSVCRRALLMVPLVVLTPAWAAAQRTLWCPVEAEIHLDACADQRPDRPDVTPVRVRDGCVGEPGLSEPDPACRQVALVDEWHNPIPVACTITLARGERRVVLVSCA